MTNDCGPEIRFNDIRMCSGEISSNRIIVVLVITMIIMIISVFNAVKK